MIKQSVWSKMNKDLKEKMKDYSYTIDDVIRITGCSKSALRIYIIMGLIRPRIILHKLVFNERLVNKVDFLSKLSADPNYSKFRQTYAALYDYMYDNGLKPVFEDINLEPERITEEESELYKNAFK